MKTDQTLKESCRPGDDDEQVLSQLRHVLPRLPCVRLRLCAKPTPMQHHILNNATSHPQQCNITPTTMQHHTHNNATSHPQQCNITSIAIPTSHPQQCNITSIAIPTSHPQQCNNITSIAMPTSHVLRYQRHTHNNATSLTESSPYHTYKDTTITRTNITCTNITRTNITCANITCTNITCTNITCTNITCTNINHITYGLEQLLHAEDEGGEVGGRETTLLRRLEAVRGELQELLQRK